MDLLTYYVSLRKDMISEITAVKNAEFSLFWDDTKPNYRTRSDLERILAKYVKHAQAFGLYVVTRHCYCENAGQHDDYPVDNRYGLTIVYGDDKYVWSGDQFYQGERTCKCPCSVCNNAISKHWVIDDVIYDKNADLEVCRSVTDILFDVTEAISKSGDRAPRSGIREYLLRAIIRINDQILPVKMDQYIEHQLQLSMNQKN